MLTSRQAISIHRRSLIFAGGLCHDACDGRRAWAS
jgi:hypothetical protein